MSECGSSRDRQIDASESFPVSDFWSVKEGFTIHKSNKKWLAIIVAEAEGRRQIRLYVWIKRDGQWKVDLCRLELRWNMDKIAQKVKELRQKWGIKAPVDVE